MQKENRWPTFTPPAAGQSRRYRGLILHRRSQSMRAYAAGAEQGVWDALLETLVELGLTDDWQHMIDSTTIRDHSQAAGAEGGLIRPLLVDHAAALQRKSTPVALHVVEGAWSALVTDRRADRLPADDPPEVPSSS